jgi:hypothetical protein
VSELFAVLDLVLDADLREIRDWHRSAERAHWIGGHRPVEGIPSSALGPRSAGYPGTVRDLGTRPLDRRRKESVFEAHPAFAVLSTDYDEPADQLVAGAALERALLTATRAGISASFLDQPLDYDDLRAKVQLLTKRRGYADMIIRFGYSRPGTGTARRPVADFLPKKPQ